MRRRAACVVSCRIEFPAPMRSSAGKIDRVRLPAHVTLPAIASAFAAAAGFFLAAKCAADLRAARAGVHVCNPAIASDRAHEFLRFAHVVRENRRRSTLAARRCGSRSLRRNRDRSANKAAARRFRAAQFQNQVSPFARHGVM